MNLFGAFLSLLTRLLASEGVLEILGRFGRWGVIEGALLRGAGTGCLSFCRAGVGLVRVAVACRGSGTGGWGEGDLLRGAGTGCHSCSRAGESRCGDIIMEGELSLDGDGDSCCGESESATAGDLAHCGVGIGDSGEIDPEGDRAS